MREKACDLVYLNTKKYLSFKMLKSFYFKIFILHIFMVTISAASIVSYGVNWKTLFPLISFIVWSLLYWIFVFVIASKRTKKTFELRFLVNGISCLFTSSIVWLIGTSVILVADDQIVGFDFSLWVLFFYFLFSAAIIGFTVLKVHKGVYKKIREKSRTPKAIAIASFFAAIIPISGALGIYTSKLLRAYTSDKVQNIAIIVCFVLLVFLPALGHINFVQYYYCRKYNILCDEFGNPTSPMLEPKYNKSKEPE